MVEVGRHRSGGPRRPVVLAGVLTAVVLAGAAVGVARGRDGGPLAPLAVDRTAPAVTAAGPSAPPPTGAPPTGAPPNGAPPTGAQPTGAQPTGAQPTGAQPTVPGAGPLRAAPRTTTTAPTRAPIPAASTPTPASRAGRPAPRPGGTAGRATFYTLAGLPACGYPDAAATGTYAAVSPADFRGSAACGTVLDVTGPAGTVRVTVSDLCPECGAGHVDLAAPAFARIAAPVAGIVPVTVAEVADPPGAGPLRIRVKEGSSPYWLALLPIGTGNPLTAVEVTGAAGRRVAARSGYGYWIVAAGAGAGPYRVRMTDARGHTATATVPLSPGTTVPTGTRLY